MSDPIVIGAQGAIEQRIRFRWHPYQGPSTVRTWLGPRASIQALLPQLKAFGYAYEFGPDSGQYYRVEATIGFGIDGSGVNDPANIIDTWELLPNVVEKDLLRADIAVINAISDTQKSNLQTSINSNDPSVDTGASANPARPITDTTARALWPYMKRGESSVKVFAPVIRHTQTVSNSATIQAAFSNIERLFSSTAMGPVSGTNPNGQGVPPGILFSVPTKADPPDTNLRYAWYKNWPTVTTSFGAKAQITQDWEFGLWNTIVLGAVI